MSCYRALVLGLCALIVAGCGFRPLYGGGRNSEAATEFASIRIDPIADRIGQQLHNHLLDLLNPRGRAVETKYVLRVELKGSTQGLAIAKSELATRSNYRLIATFQLVTTSNNEVVLTSSQMVVSSYDILISNFATLMAEKDAKTRAAQELSQIIRTQLAIYFVQRRADRKKGIE
jgi:LPS-assembly lipoprotein